MAPDLSSAIESPEPLLAMRAVLQARIDRGAKQADLIAELTVAMLQASADGRDAEDDLLAEGLDIVHGVVSPHLKLVYPTRDIPQP